MADIETKRHSLAHVLAMAVLDSRPDAKLGIGPAIENGFYYDFDFNNITTCDVVRIENKMREMIKGGFKFEREEISADKAKKIFQNQPFKMELIAELEKDNKPISIYRSGEFIDLCSGPHINSAKDLRKAAFKLTKIAGAYWRGSEKNQMLTRIYGVAFETPDELKNYLTLQEEAEKRDHRRLGKDLEIFFFSEEIGQGLPVWLPNGTIIKDLLEDLAKKKEAAGGYRRVSTPVITKENLFIKSGHLPHYRESMYPAMDIEGENYYLKPMNCPFHHEVFASRPRSYRELPLRLAEYGLCHRYEKSGELQGLMRVRSMEMNDAHIYVRPGQVKEEIKKVIRLHEFYYNLFDVKRAKYRLSLHDKKELGKKYIDMPEAWTENEKILREVLKELKLDYYEAENEAAFYGPKIDIQIYSAIGKEYTLGTVQLDFSQPRSFNLKYINERGGEEMPYVIHRAPLSTHERFIGFLLEHYAGAFPFWLAPVQIKIIPVSEKVNDYAGKIFEALEKENFRTGLDDGNETLSKRIRSAELKKIPYILVAGEKEEKSETISVRERGKGNSGAMKIEDFIKKAKVENNRE